MWCAQEQIEVLAYVKKFQIWLVFQCSTSSTEGNIGKTTNTEMKHGRGNYVDILLLFYRGKQNKQMSKQTKTPLKYQRFIQVLTLGSLLC